MIPHPPHRKRGAAGCFFPGSAPSIRNLNLLEEDVPMASNRIGRINEEIQRELAKPASQPEGPPGAVHHDIHHPGGDYAGPALCQGLRQFPGQEQGGRRSEGAPLRRRLPPARELGAALQLRYTPELQWQEDDSITRGAHMLDLLNSLHIAKDDEHESSDHS